MSRYTAETTGTSDRGRDEIESTLERRARRCTTHHACDCWHYRAVRAEAEAREARGQIERLRERFETRGGALKESWEETAELRAMLAAALPGDAGHRPEGHDELIRLQEREKALIRIAEELQQQRNDLHDWVNERDPDLLAQFMDEESIDAP